jgi:hypothetical protein
MWYNQPELLVGEHELHLGNVMCGGHRRHKYRSIDKTKKKINGLTVTTCLLPLFISFMHAELYLRKTKSVVYGTANFTTTVSSLAAQSAF